MNRNYHVESVEPRDRISHEDFFRPQNRVTLIRVEDGAVLQLFLSTRRSPKRGEKILLDDREVQANLSGNLRN